MRDRGIRLIVPYYKTGLTGGMKNATTKFLFKYGFFLKIVKSLYM